MMKINTLNDEATKLFRANLIESQVAFKQLGTAFLIPEDTGTHNPSAFSGLWIGVDANIEIQEICPVYDASQELYKH